MASNKRLSRLSLHGLDLKAALKGAMQVKPPADSGAAKPPKTRTPKAKKTRKKRA
ncbi:MAG: hypothetical protein AMXMBFR58_15310 [Phycisphaerae bacterium]